MSDRRPILNSLALSGLAATFVGNGIGRFAYIALMPVLIQQAWFSRTEATTLGAATLLGYLAGVPLTGRLRRHTSSTSLLRMGMLMCSLSYLCCAWYGGGFVWSLFWRTMAGVGGAVAMVLAPNIVLSRSPVSERARISGVIFSGVGLGAMVSGTIIPLVVGLGLVETWLLLGGICLLLTIATWKTWPDHTQTANSTLHAIESDVALPAEQVATVGFLLVAYGLNAVGYLPHTLFWVDYICRELHHSIAVGGFFWAVFGVSAAAGPFLTGSLADRFGYSKTLAAGFLLKAFGVALPLLNNSPIALFSSSVLVGLFTPGIAALVSGYTMAIVGVALHRQYWGWMTFSFAASQVATGFAMVLIMVNRESYQIVFALSAWSLLGATFCIAAIQVLARRVGPSPTKEKSISTVNPQ